VQTFLKRLSKFLGGIPLLWMRWKIYSKTRHRWYIHMTGVHLSRVVTGVTRGLGFAFFLTEKWDLPHWDWDLITGKWIKSFGNGKGISDSSFRYNCLKSNKLIFQIKIIKLFLIIK
jgi:hypothetical protein